MRVSYRWLSDYVDPGVEPRELAKRLTGNGVAVEVVTSLNPGIKGVYVGQIVSMEAHPGADKLLVCRASLGDRGVSIVTGAPNLKVGDKVPVALDGAQLPGGWTIQSADFRGVLSEGMLCSETELLEGKPHKENEGVWVLPPELSAGEDAVSALGLDDMILELDLTPNYAAHCLSMVGVAQEVAALTGGAMYWPVAEVREAGGDVHQLARVEIEDPELCGRYTARIIDGVRIGPSPAWMQERLRAAAMRPINNIVDVTNYVMLELGQPLHAFDYHKIASRHIIVRRARPGERLVTLDGTDRALDTDMLLIADEQGPIGLAGVMGGLDSEVTDQTTTILLESAHFNNINNRRTSRLLALPSEASNRFTKGVDPNGTIRALDRAAQLMGELGGGRVIGGAIDCYPRPLVPRVIPLRPARANASCGIKLEAPEMADLLERVGFGVMPATAPEVWEEVRRSCWEISPPPVDPVAREAYLGAVEERLSTARQQAETWIGSFPDLLVAVVPTRRLDIDSEVDLIEEVARLYGYNRIPLTLPVGPATKGGKPRAQSLIDIVRESLVSAGLNEVITYSFGDPRSFDRLRLPADHPLRAAIRLRNPLGEERSVMRTTLLPGVLDTLSYNITRRIEDQFFFEASNVYRPRALPLAELPDERLLLAIAVTGAYQDKTWNQPRRDADFYYAKGLLDLVMSTLGITDWHLVPGDHPSLHPGRRATIRLGKSVPRDKWDIMFDRFPSTSGDAGVGVIGELHPEIQEEIGLPRRVGLIELDISSLLNLATEDKAYRPLPRFPAVTRDLAIVMRRDVLAREILDVIRDAGGELLESVALFDLYQGDPVPKGFKSLAYSLVYRAAGKTLTDVEVEEVHRRVREALAREVGAELRS